MCDIEESVGYGRVYASLLYDDSCLLKPNLARNRTYPHLAGPVLLACYLDAYNVDDQGGLHGFSTISVPMRELFSEGDVAKLIRSTSRRQPPNVRPSREGIRAAFRRTGIPFR